MRRLSGPVIAILMSALCVPCALAADALSCAGCDVASALAQTLEHAEGQKLGLSTGDGYWMLSARFEDLESAAVGGPARLYGNNSGTYMLAARPGILTPSIDGGLEQFLQQRVIEDSGNPIGEYVGAGLVYRSAAVQGWRRQFGVAIGFAELATPFQRALSRSGIGVAEREATCELSYRVEVTDRFAVQSDVQFIRNPGMNATVDSSWAFGLRFELSAR
jgi:carbohydrate-selective porin OprB